MAFWKRGGSSRKGGRDDDESASRPSRVEARGVEASERGTSAGNAEQGARDTSPQRVGVVSGVLSPSAGADQRGGTLFGDVVSRRFGPRTGGERDVETDRPLPPSQVAADAAGEATEGGAAAAPQSRDALRVVAPLFPDQPDTPVLEVDSMAHIGRATTITGNIVAEEDLEIQGTIEGSVRLANHQVTVGAEGHVKASVDAEIVMVYGRITGDVVASDLVEIEKGGVVGGDVQAPRIVMHDGAIVVGRLDMSASLPNGGQYANTSESSGERPRAEDEAAGLQLAPVSSIADARSTEDDDSSFVE